MSTDDDKIVERLEFFFSDANLRMDKFLRGVIMDSYTGGFVEIETLLKFNTIKKLSTDPAVIAAAAEKIEQLKLNESKTSIARVEPFTTDMLQDNVKVSLRIGNLPIKDDEYVHTREEVHELFSEFGKVALVRVLTNYNKEEGKRSAVGKGFVEFANIAIFDQAVAELCVSGDAPDDKPKKVLKLGDTEITVKSMRAWLDKKQTFKDAKKEEKSGDKRARGEEATKNSAEIDAIEFTLDWKKGCIVFLEGLPEGCDREMLLDAVKKYVGEGVEARADYSRGDKDGKIRFNEPNEKIAEFVTKLSDGSATFGEAKVGKASIVEGEEEEKYYKDYIEFRTNQMREKARDKLNRNNKKKRRNW